MKMIHPSIRTERLVLTPYDMRDVDELYRVMGDPQVMQHIGKGPLTRSEVRDVVVRVIVSWNKTGMGWWTIRLRENGYLIGQICLRAEKDVSEIAVGYGLDASFWRQGYTREALDAVVAYGLDEKSLRRIVATVRPENTPSCALLERCGFVQEPDLFIRNKTLCLYVYSRPNPAGATADRAVAC
jgi:RimJ/RimL family protein N-acetyltransferase